MFVCMQVLYFKAVQKGWAKSYYYGDVILYSLSTALLFHAVSFLCCVYTQYVESFLSPSPSPFPSQAFFEAHNLRQSYWRFLCRLTRGRMSQLNWNEIDTFGTQASKQVRMDQEKRNINNL